MKLYITYGYGTKQRGNFSVVEGENYIEARQKAFNGTDKGRFAFTYTEEEFKGLAEKFSLTEIPLTPQEFI